MSSLIRRRLLGLRGRLWDHSLVVRRPARQLREVLSLLRSVLLDPDGPPRVVVGSEPEGVQPIAHPAVSVVLPRDQSAQGASSGHAAGAMARSLADQTETSWRLAAAAADREPDADRSPYCWIVDPGSTGLEGVPPTLLESMLMVAASGALEVVAAGRAAPARDGLVSAAELRGLPGAGRTTHLLWRSPGLGGQPHTPVLGRIVPHVRDLASAGGSGPDEPALELDAGGLIATGPWLLHPDAAGRRRVRHQLRDVEKALADLPAVDGPPTVLLMLPYLAVGGAERLLLDLVEGLGNELRCLVVTTEPHRAALGETVSRCLSLTPHVYTLGDWLPREAHEGAIRHLIRRYRVGTLLCWNGSTCFYDLAPRLRHGHPELRILNQLFNHRGGWIEHYGPRLVRSVDLHVAVNTAIAGALVEERGVPDRAVVTIHHGVEIPRLPDPAEARARRREQRRELGLPDQALVLGTFIRMSPQKRPMDVVALARRLEARGIHLLLVGGGPLDAELDAELARRPVPNLVRLPMLREQHEVLRLYDAVDICLMTSAYEGLPVFLLDGMARGLPAVAPDVGDIRLLLAEGGGTVVPRPGDLDALEAAVLGLADPAVRAAEGERARRRVASAFGLERYVESYRRVILARPVRGR
jgi:glycosyltransferase involved in cell wall biosynthesis